jgi:predicted DNA-binding transcriptional regulator AlpA
MKVVRMMRLREVISTTGLGKGTIYSLMDKEPPEFPLSVPLTDNPRGGVGWPDTAIYKYNEERMKRAEQLREVRKIVRNSKHKGGRRPGTGKKKAGRPRTQEA